MFDPKKLSVGAMISMIVMVAGMIACVAGLSMTLAGHRPAWVLIILDVGGMICMIVGVFFFDCLTKTEEEGKLPEKPPPADQEHMGCCDEHGHS